MTYDLEVLDRRVKQRRTEFMTSTVVTAAVMLIAIALAIFNDDTTYRFAFALCAVISLFYIYKNVVKYRPVSLFRDEIRGINIKEDEFVSLSRGPQSQNYRILFPSNVRGKRIQGRVYLRHENGDVSVIDGIYKAQTDVYKIGDELYRPAGAVYPIILNRSVNRQPCPWCGRVNSADESECTTCGLPIINQP